MQGYGQITRVAVLLLTVTLAFTQSAFAQLNERTIADPDFYEITESGLTEVSEEELLEEGIIVSSETREPVQRRFLQNPNQYDLARQISTGQVLLNAIANIGRLIWDIVKDSQPVVSFNQPMATGLPKGLNDWEALEGWERGRSRLFRKSYVNGMGFTVMDFVYRIRYMHGGSALGRGQYLTHVTVTAEYAKALIPFSISSKVKIAEPYNMGTRENPIAALQVDVVLETGHLLRRQAETTSFEIRGDGRFDQL